MKVVVVGLGALGSHLVLNARNFPVDWVFCDFDSVELKNLKSQWFTKQGVGVNKAQAAALALRQFYGVQARTFPVELKEHNVTQVMGDAQLVVDAVDNAPTRDLISAWGTKVGVPVLHLAISAGGDFGRVAWTAPGHPVFQADSAPPGTPTCEDGGMLPRIALVASVGAEALREGLQGVFRDHNVAPGRFRV